MDKLGKKIPEQKNYCQPARKIADDVYDGILRVKDAKKLAEIEIKKCRETNKLGAHLSTAEFAQIFANRALAESESRSAIALSPNESEAHRRLCMVTINQVERSAICDSLKRFASESVLATLTLAGVAQERSNFGEAIRLLDEVIRRRPEFGLAWLNRGITKSNSGDLENALIDLDKAIARLPEKSNDMITAKSHRWHVLELLGRTKKAD